LSHPHSADEEPNRLLVLQGPLIKARHEMPGNSGSHPLRSGGTLHEGKGRREEIRLRGFDASAAHEASRWDADSLVANPPGIECRAIMSGPGGAEEFRPEKAVN